MHSWKLFEILLDILDICSHFFETSSKLVRDILLDKFHDFLSWLETFLKMIEHVCDLLLHLLKFHDFLFYIPDILGSFCDLE